MDDNAQVGAAGEDTSQEAVPPYRANPPAAIRTNRDEVAERADAMDPAVAMVQAELRQLQMRSAAMVDLAIGVTMQTLGHEEYTLPAGAIEEFQKCFRVEHNVQEDGSIAYRIVKKVVQP